MQSVEVFQPLHSAMLTFASTICYIYWIFIPFDLVASSWPSLQSCKFSLEFESIWVCSYLLSVAPISLKICTHTLLFMLVPTNYYMTILDISILCLGHFSMAASFTTTCKKIEILCSRCVLESSYDLHLIFVLCLTIFDSLQLDSAMVDLALIGFDRWSRHIALPAPSF